MIILRKWLDDLLLIRRWNVSYLETFPALPKLDNYEGASQLLWTPYGYQIEIHTLGPELMDELKKALDEEKLIPKDLMSSERWYGTGKFKARNLKEEYLSGRQRIQVDMKWEEIPKLLRVLRKFSTVTIPGRVKMI